MDQPSREVQETATSGELGFIWIHCLAVRHVSVLAIEQHGHLHTSRDAKMGCLSIPHGQGEVHDGCVMDRPPRAASLLQRIQGRRAVCVAIDQNIGDTIKDHLTGREDSRDNRPGSTQFARVIQRNVGDELALCRCSRNGVSV